MEKTNFLKANSNKLRQWTFYIGLALLFIAGLLFIIVVDTKVKILATEIKTGSNTTMDFTLSAWLFFAMIFTIGGGIFYFYGDSVKHKHVKTLVFKGIGILLAALFIVFLSSFEARAVLVESYRGISKAALASIHSICTISLVFIIISLVILVINYILSIIFIEEDY